MQKNKERSRSVRERICKMKILVFSDSHGSPEFMKEMISRNRRADAVIFLGDGQRDIELMRSLFPEIAFITVRGNCDFGSDAPLKEIINLDGKRIFCAHGHEYNVKFTTYNIVCAAREAQADILLFGHTHQAVCEYDDGLHIMNPGSASGYGASCGVIDILPQGILTNIVHRK